jgi:hypothetical protein
MFVFQIAVQFLLLSKIQNVPKRCIYKINIPYYNVYASFWDTLYSREWNPRYAISFLLFSISPIVVIFKNIYNKTFKAYLSELPNPYPNTVVKMRISLFIPCRALCGIYFVEVFATTDEILAVVVTHSLICRALTANVQWVQRGAHLLAGDCRCLWVFENEVLNIGLYAVLEVGKKR